MQYIKSLDAIRAFAVILVIISHWVPYPDIQKLSLGHVGVDIFFVLSGFLISRNLLIERKRNGESVAVKFKDLKNFVIRRALRIFPVYYLLLILLRIFHEQTGTSIKENFIYYATYTTNILYFKTNNWDGILSHLWSLAVEEQFYLFWPWILIFAPWKHTYKTIVIFIITGLLCNIGLQYFLPENQLSKTLMPACIGAFAIGAWWAYITVEKENLVSRYVPVVFSVAVICCVVYFSTKFYNISFFFPEQIFVSFFSLGLIVFAVHYPDSFLHKHIFYRSLPILIGKISYGIYLYHNIVPWALNFIIPNSVLDQLFSGTCNFTLLIFKFSLRALFLFGLSWVSFKVIEKPINDLKVRFK